MGEDDPFPSSASGTAIDFHAVTDGTGSGAPPRIGSVSMPNIRVLVVSR